MTLPLHQQLTSLPTNPGVYLFKNAQNNILYVGKAKLLRSRVQSYFREKATLDPAKQPRKIPPASESRGRQMVPSPDLDPAKQQMVPKIAAIETIITDTENEALILEANLIRQHRPPYNVVLTDDKYYLFIKITTGEDLPRVFPVRRLKQDNARYFGPYSSARSVRHTLKLLRRIFPYRAEKDSPHDIVFPHPLFSRSEKSVPHSPAQSAGEGGLPSESYNLNIQNIIRFLQGDRQEIIDTLQQGMKAAAAEKKFERAGIFRDQLQAIERLEGYQKVFLPRPESFDVISIVTDGSRSAANILAVRRGKLLDKNTFLLKHQRQTKSADILRQFLLQYYHDAQDIPPTIFTPEELSDTNTIAQWINKERPPIIAQPFRGKKRQLMVMGALNAQQLLMLETKEFLQDARLTKALRELAEKLNLVSPHSAKASRGNPLSRIETYDISNIQGQQATGSMIVFVNGQGDKSQYRKFRITTKDTPDDYHMLQEVLRRRFSGRHANWKQPDLLLIDGGKGQLNAAHKVLKELHLQIPIASIAKREEILFTLEGSPRSFREIRLPYDSNALYLIQRMRDEAHRFVITYHRLLRSKQSQRSLLDEIPGIGPSTKKSLLNHFGSLKNIRAATDEELIKLIGESRTKSLRNFL